MHRLHINESAHRAIIDPDRLKSESNRRLPSLSLNASRMGVREVAQRIILVAALVVGVGMTGTASAEPAAMGGPLSGATKSLDEQVQEIKSDVLGIAAELGNLEEKLLYPSNTQIAVFVALQEGESIEVDSAQISIDGELVAHHIYSFKEVAALEKGGVQRIYTGNLPTGAHQLEVSISGKRTGGKNFQHEEKFAFDKEVDPKLLGVTLSGGAIGNTSVEIEDW